MRIGCCVNMVALAPDGIGIERLEALAAFGYDYVEMPLAQIMVLGESQFSALIEYVASVGIPCEACNNFIPAHYPITGDKVDRVQLEAYLDEAIERACRLGAKSVVFGSSGAKNVPPGFSVEKAWGQIVETLVLADEIIGDRDLRIAIEPLCRVESNIIAACAFLPLNEGCVWDILQLTGADSFSSTVGTTIRSGVPVYVVRRNVNARSFSEPEVAQLVLQLLSETAEMSELIENASLLN